MAKQKTDRNDPPTSLARVGPVETPDWLMEVQDDDSLDNLEQYRILPRAKVIQAMTKKEVKDQFGEGSLIMVPGTLLATDKQSFDFVPVFFFTEFQVRSDRSDKVNPFIWERTFDETSEIAKRSRNKDLREEVYPGGTADKPWKKRWVETLNFCGYIYGDHDQRGTPLVLTFARGEFSKGRAWINAIMSRKVRGVRVPLWCQVWTISTGYREFGEKKWYGIDFENPENPWIQADEKEAFKGFYQELKNDFEKKRILVDHGENDDGDTEVEVEVATGDAPY
jgi:hypothetical protein